MPNFGVNSPDPVGDQGVVKPPLYTRGNSKIGSGVMHRKQGIEILKPEGVGKKPFQPSGNINANYNIKSNNGYNANNNHNNPTKRTRQAQIGGSYGSLAAINQNQIKQ